MIKDVPGLEKHLHGLIKAQCDVAVIGLSGGADSTLVATLCAGALGKANVVGVHMPYDKKVDVEGTKFNARSVRLARKLGIDNDRYVPVTAIADEICKAIDPSIPDFLHGKHKGELTKLDMGNARARARMCVLYGLAGQLAHGDYEGKRVRVVGTGNLSEDFIGYDTKGGDALTDFHPIGRLFKSEVYQFLDWYKAQGIIDEEHIDRVPSAGLWDGQTDEGELGHTYNEMERAIKDALYNDRATLWDAHSRAPLEYHAGYQKVADFVLGRYHANKHKHAAIPSFDISEFVD